MIVLGSKVKDPVSGFTGMANARCVYRTGCIHIEVLPKGLHKETGQPLASRWFDEELLEVVVAAKAKKTRKKTTGGPRPDSASHPS